MGVLVQGETSREATWTQPRIASPRNIPNRLLFAFLALLRALRLAAILARAALFKPLFLLALFGLRFGILLLLTFFFSGHVVSAVRRKFQKALLLVRRFRRWYVVVRTMVPLVIHVGHPRHSKSIQSFPTDDTRK